MRRAGRANAGHAQRLHGRADVEPHDALHRAALARDANDAEGSDDDHHDGDAHDDGDRAAGRVHVADVVDELDAEAGALPRPELADDADADEPERAAGRIRLDERACGDTPTRGANARLRSNGEPRADVGELVAVLERARDEQLDELGQLEPHESRLRRRADAEPRAVAVREFGRVRCDGWW
jgi:hypothetical protein